MVQAFPFERRLILSFAFVAFAQIAFLACTTGDVAIVPAGDPTSSSDPPANASVEASASTPCTALCSREQACAPDFAGTDECTRVCNEENHFSKLRDDVKPILTQCLAERSCKSVLANDAVLACIVETPRALIAATTAAVTLCTALAPARTDCGTPLSYDDCLVRAKIYNDATLADGQRCIGLACRDLERCIANVFVLAASASPEGPTLPPAP